MRTSEEIYHRVRWDPRFDPSRFAFGVEQRGRPPKLVPFPAFTPGGDIPWHRVLFAEAEGELVWDRATGLDRVDASGLGLARRQRQVHAPFFTARTPHTWDPVQGWQPTERPTALAAERAAASAGAPEVERLRVLTWNTLWDRYDSDRVHTARRRPLLLAALASADADVIALQEVEAELLAMVLREPWVRDGYTLSADPRGADVDDSGLLLLSRLPVLEAGWHVLGRHKAVAAVVVDTAAGPVVVATTHLSSDHSDDGSGRRKDQLAQLAEGLASVACPLVLMGDFNDGSTGPDGPDGRLGLLDAWTVLRGPADQTPTFDPVVNPLAAVSSLSGRASRLDRVLVRPGVLRPDEVVLLGDEPDADGLYISDHYGVDVTLAAAADASVSASAAAEILDTAPTARTAVAWIPPEALWPTIQEIRARHDPQIHRWPPHVNVVFGFVPESEFEQAVPLVAAAATETAPFDVVLDGLRSFSHREDATVWLDPVAEQWAGLRESLARRFPACLGQEIFTPHLTLGKVRDAHRADIRLGAGPMAARVGELAVLSRRGDEPMRVRASVALGSGEVRWWSDDAEVELEVAAARRRPDEAVDHGGPRGGTASARSADRDRVAGPDATTDRAARLNHSAGRVAHLVEETLAEGVVHRVGSRRLGCSLPGADLDLVAVLPGIAEGDDVERRIRAALPSGSRVRQLVGARVPGLRLHVADLSVDVVIAPSGTIPPAEAVARRAELAPETAVALSAVSDAETVLHSVAPADISAFTRLATGVKAWARARGLDSAPFGGLPGLAWVVMAARSVAAVEDASAALGHFFATWAAWDWHDPIALTEPIALTNLTAFANPTTSPQPSSLSVPSWSAVTVLTPSEPIRNCATQVGPGFRDLLAQELYEAWEIVESAADPWPRLLAPPPLHRRHAAWAVVDVSAADPEDFSALAGRARGRMRALMTALEEAGVAEAHAWPRPFLTSPAHAAFSIGLGRVPPSRATFDEIAARWVKGLPGVAVSLRDGGAVPTLR